MGTRVPAFTAGKRLLQEDTSTTEASPSKQIRLDASALGNPLNRRIERLMNDRQEASGAAI